MGNHLIGHPTNLISAIFGDQPCSVSFSFIVGNKCAGKRVWRETKESAGSTLDPVFRRDSSDVIRNN